MDRQQEFVLRTIEEEKLVDGAPGRRESHDEPPRAIVWPPSNISPDQ